MSYSSFWQKGLSGPACVVYYYANLQVQEGGSKFSIFRFKNQVTREQVIRKMKKEGCIPADLTELQEFRNAFGDSLTEDMGMIAFTQDITGDEAECAGILVREQGVLRMYLFATPSVWPPNSHFLGILESAKEEPKAPPTFNKKAFKTFGNCPN